MAINMMGIVSAADQTITNTTSGGLKTAIGNVSTGGTVYMENGVYSGNDNIGIRINKSLTIQGKGNNVVIDAKGANRIFSIQNGANFILNNIILQNGRPNWSDGSFSDRGGAIYVNWGSINCNNVVFYNNSASRWGGAVCIQDTLPTSSGNSFINCKFISNNADEGGAVEILASDVSFTFCIFENNEAVEGGGAVWIGYGYDPYFSYCNFNNNFAGQKGGAIATYGRGTLENCNFNENKLISANVYNAIYDHYGRISTTNCVITPTDGTKVSSTNSNTTGSNSTNSNNSTTIGSGNSNTTKTNSNTVTPTTPTSKKADLKITKITKKANIRYVFIKNVGKASAGKNTLGVYIGKTLINKVTVKSIGVGKTLKVKVAIPKKFMAKKYVNKFKIFKVDIRNVVKESNKKNNSFKAK